VPLLTVTDLERDSHISKYTWWSWIREGKLPVVRLGRRIRVEMEAYQHFIAQNRVEGRVPARRDDHR